MSSYVGVYYTKFEPFSREKKVTRVDFFEASAGFSKESPGIRARTLKIEAIMRPAEQGGRGGRCSGGCRPASCCVFVSLSFRGIHIQPKPIMDSILPKVSP
jgi:hypothetical protein